MSCGHSTDRGGVSSAAPEQKQKSLSVFLWNTLHSNYFQESQLIAKLSWIQRNCPACFVPSLGVCMEL